MKINRNRSYWENISFPLLLKIKQSLHYWNFLQSKPQAVRLSANSYRMIALFLLLLGFFFFFFTAALAITNQTAKNTAVLFWKFTTYSAQTRKWGVVLLKPDIQKRVFLTHDLQWTGIPLLKISSLPWTSLPQFILSQLCEKWHIMEKTGLWEILILFS